MPQKALLLLVRLRLAEGGELSRDAAAAFLWTVDDHTLALANLRKMLSRLQVAQAELGTELVVADGRRLKLAPQAIDSDLDIFDDPTASIATLVEHVERGFLRTTGDAQSGVEGWAHAQRINLLGIIRRRLTEPSPSGTQPVDFLTLRKAAFLLLDHFPDDHEVRHLVTGADHAARPPLASGHPPVVAVSVPDPVAAPPPRALSGPRVALLPPAGVTADNEDALLAAALIDDVSICLCAVRAFAMVAPYTAERIRASQDKAGLLEKHDISYVIDTRLSRDSLMVQIIFVPADNIIFADRYPLNEASLAESRLAIAEAISGTILSILARNETAHLDYELNPKAYRGYLTGLRHLNRLTLPSIRAARRTFRGTLKERADFAYAFGGLARTFTGEWVLTARGDNDLLLKAEEAARSAIESGPAVASGYKELGRARLYLGQLDESLEALDNAEKLSPHYADAIYTYADSLVHASRPREGLEKIEQAISLNPLGPDEYFWSAAGASYFVGEYLKSIDYLNRMANPAVAYRLLAASLAMAGDRKKAQHYRRKDLKENPQFSLKQWLAVLPIREHWQRELYREGLLKAGYED